MILKYNIVPDSDTFTWPDVAAVCTCLGGESATLDYIYDPQGNLICGDFALRLSYLDFRKITGCSKYFSVHDNCEHIVITESEEVFNFVCIVSRSFTGTEQLCITEFDANTGAPKSQTQFDLGVGQFHLTFLQERDKYLIEYRVGVHPQDNKLMLFNFSIVDQRHLYPEDTAICLN